MNQVAFFSTLLLSTLLSNVQASLYVIHPQPSTVCHGNQACAVAWLDDGNSPLLTSIGVCTVGLYTGDQQLVQRIEPVDVATTQALTFTPNPKAGPVSNHYYISFISTTLKLNGSTPYIAYSPSFSIENMQGSFDSPLNAATSTLPIPASITSIPPSSTVTIGTLDTSLPPISSLVPTAPAPSSSSSSKKSAAHQTVSIPFHWGVIPLCIFVLA